MKYYAISENDMKNIANAIRNKKQRTDGMTVSQMSEEIASIETVRYVTFMVGDVEVYRKAVVVGDTCPDPVAQGFIETPAKESTAQYEYTFYGWGASNNGAADDTILQGITKDTIVYAIFVATVKTYTITWFDDDGVTVLKTEQVPYGTTPSYVPKKEGLFCTGWIPAVIKVTTAASYTAVWAETVTILSPKSITVEGNYNKSGPINLGQSYTFRSSEKYLVTFGASGYEKTYVTTAKEVEIVRYSSSYNANRRCVLGNPFEIRTYGGERPTSIDPYTIKNSGEPFAITLNNTSSSTVANYTASSIYVMANKGTYTISIQKIAT